MAETVKKCRLRVVAQVPLIDGLQTTYEEFRDQYMRPNSPVLISGLMDHWRAFDAWSSPCGAPNLDYLSSNFENSHVQVAECSTKEFTDQRRVDMTLAEYITYWKGSKLDGKESDGKNTLLYLKDWHFLKDYPEYHPYDTPLFFMDDWLNTFLDRHQLHPSTAEMETVQCLSDYRFVYMGPKGTWTPLHADVFRSYSWSGNVCGRKLWHLLPPSETNFLFDKHKRSSVYDIYSDISVDEYPLFYKAGWLECVQERGQIIFVPSGWYHQVTNLEDTISINHNWFNGYNLHHVWELLLADYEEAKASIEDIRHISDNFEELCQRNLAANSGMNFHDFFVFLRRMMILFMSCLYQTNNQKRYNRNEKLCSVQDIRYKCNMLGSQILFNLQSMARVAHDLASADIFQKDMLASLKGLQFFDGCDKSKDRAAATKNDLAQWIDNAQHSEYQDFLVMLTKSCTCSGNAYCFVNQISFGECKDFKMAKSKACDGLADQETISVDNIKDFEVEIKTPFVLVQVITEILDELRQTYQVKF